MEVAARKYSGTSVLAGRSPLLRLQSDERLIALTRRGNVAAFETLVARYESRLLAFCRHMLSSREDAEDVLQEVMAAAFGAITADERPINARPWLYRIARNRCLNHLRRAQPIGVDSMDVHFGDGGRSTADKVDEREAFRLLVDDIQDLPETQKTALVLRELEALSYEQIAEAMETTIPSVKSLLVRARASLAEASEARLLSCEEVRIELAEVAEGLRSRPSPPVRRHVKSCDRCSIYSSEIRRTGRALGLIVPIGPLALARKVLFGKGAIGAWGHSSGVTGTVGASSAASGSIAAAGAGAGATAATSSSLLTAGVGAIATKAVAGLAAAALVTAGAVEAGNGHARRTLAASTPSSNSTASLLAGAPAPAGAGAIAATVGTAHVKSAAKKAAAAKQQAVTDPHALVSDKSATTTVTTPTTTAPISTSTTILTSSTPATTPVATTVPSTLTSTDSGGAALTGAATTSTAPGTSTTTASTTSTSSATSSGSSTSTSTSTTPTQTTPTVSAGSADSGTATDLQ